MQPWNTMFELLWIGLTLVEAYPVQLYGYGPPSSELKLPPRPLWDHKASNFPGRPGTAIIIPAHSPAIHNFPRPHELRQPPLTPVPARVPYSPYVAPRLLPHSPKHVSPVRPNAPQRHVYWYRPRDPAFRAPISLPRSRPLSTPVQPIPHPTLSAPFRPNSHGYLRKPSNSHTGSAAPAGNYEQYSNTAKISQTRVFTSPLRRDPGRIFIGQFQPENPAISDGTNIMFGDEFPREDLTTPKADMDAAESQANVSSRHPRKWYFADGPDSDGNDVQSHLEGGCGAELSCRTSYHCGLLGGRPTFVPCGPSPRLYCCDLSVQSTVNTSANSTVKSDPQCGWNREKTSRIIGGNDAEFGEIPWQAFVKVDGFRCGGALLSRTHVVTAAHCVVGKNKSKIEVLLGELVLKRMIEELPHERRHVAQVIIHPDYENLNVDSHDVAILVLDKPVEYQANIVPICLPDPEDSFIGVMATVSGWGRVFADHEIRSNHLQSVQVPIIGNRVCRKWLRSRGKYAGINADHVCAGYEEGGKDSCRGDSGGPLTYQKNGRWYLIGIVSAGFSCGKPRQPGIYHRVSHSVEWISKNVFS